MKLGGIINITRSLLAVAVLGGVGYTIVTWRARPEPVKACQEAVAARLVYPRGADFEDKPTKRVDSNESNHIDGIVYSQNAFGGMGPVRYSCIVDRYGAVSVRLEQ